MTVFKTDCRVRYVETDCAGVAHYTSFFYWFETGRMEMWRELDLPYYERLPIAEAHCRYLAPAVFDDLLEVHSYVSEIRTRGFRIDQRIHRKKDGKLLAEGYTGFVTVDGERRPVEVFPEFRERFEEHLEK